MFRVSSSENSEPGQAAQVVVVFDRRALGTMRTHALDVGVTNQQGAFPVEVVNVTSLCPVGRPGGRALQTIHDTGDAGQDQLDLRLKTALRRLVLPSSKWSWQTPSPIYW